MRSSSLRLFASMAKAIDGSGTPAGWYAIKELFSANVSPVNVSFSFATAPTSPACNSVTGIKVLPSGTPICANRSSPLLRTLRR